MTKNKKTLIKLIYLVAGFLLITWTFSTNLYIDESFTLGLVKNNWSQIITLDAMDVHPPCIIWYLNCF